MLAPYPCNCDTHLLLIRYPPFFAPQRTRTMTRFAVLLASFFTVSVATAEPPTRSASKVHDHRETAADAPAEMTKHHSIALHEYNVRLGEFDSGRSPVNVVLQSAQRLLHASLEAEIANSALLYEKRIKDIEVIARRNLGLGTCTVQEVAQAESSRLDALLKRLLKQPSR